MNGPDDSLSYEPYWTDSDSDGYGDFNDIHYACEQPSGTVGNGEDCDDTDGDIHPGATEICDGLDNDCMNGPDDSVSYEPYWTDADNDGYGDPNDIYYECEQPSGTASNDEDCDDTDPDINPDAHDEPNDGIDQDCDGNDAYEPFEPHAGMYISPDGDDNNDCSHYTPCLTIGRASSEAVGQGLETVYAAGGTYSDTSRAALQVNLQGGLDPVTWAIEPEYNTTEFEYTANNLAVVYTSGSVDVSVHDVTFTTAGIGVENRSNSSLLLERVLVQAGNAPALDLRSGLQTTVVRECTLTNQSGTTVDLTSGGFLEMTNSAVHNNNTVSSVAGISSGNNADLTVADSHIRAHTPLYLTGGTAELTGLSLEASSIGAVLGGDGQVRLRDSNIEVCQNGETSPYNCEGMRLNGSDTIVDGVTVRVHNNNSTENFGVRFQGDGGSIVDSILHLGTTPNGDTFGVAGTGTQMVVANSIISLGDNSRRSWLVRQSGSSANLVLVNNILDPGSVQQGGGNVLNVVSTTTSVTLLNNKLEHAPPSWAIYISSPFATLDWSQANSCAGWSTQCTSADGNSEGLAGLHDPNNDDFRLDDGAACIDAGTDISAWIPSEERSTDMLGTSRDGTPDCGPTEWVPGQF